MKYLFGTIATIFSKAASPLVKGLRAVMRAGITQKVIEDEHNYIIEVWYFDEKVDSTYLSKRKATRINV